jgi:lysine 6-dehydrogenase
MRVEVRGRTDDGETTIRYDLVDYFDPETGVTAMMRTTGYSLAITALMQVDGRILESGARTPDYAVPADEYVRELADRGIRIERTESAATEAAG